MSPTELKLECLRLAVEAASTPDEVVKLAQDFYAFVDGRSALLPDIKGRSRIGTGLKSVRRAA